MTGYRFYKMLCALWCGRHSKGKTIVKFHKFDTRVQWSITVQWHTRVQSIPECSVTLECCGGTLECSGASVVESRITLIFRKWEFIFCYGLKVYLFVSSEVNISFCLLKKNYSRETGYSSIGRREKWISGPRSYG